MSVEDFRAQLEKENDPEQVRRRLGSGEYEGSSRKVAQAYLDSCERTAKVQSRNTRPESEEPGVRWSKWAVISGLVGTVVLAAAVSRGE